MKTRKIHCDIIKIISIVFVMYIHTGNRAMYMYSDTEGFGHLLSFFMNEFVQMGTVLFFMVSGILLLSKDEDIKTLLFHRVLRYAAVLVVFSLFQRLYWAAVSGVISDFSLKESFRTMYETGVITQYWFLYAYLGMLLMLPFLRMIAKSLTEKTMIYLFVLVIVFMEIFPVIGIIFDLGRFNVSLDILGTMMLVPLLGYGIEYTMDEFLQKKNNRLMVYCIGLFVFVMNFVYTHHTYINSGRVSYSYIEGTYIIFAVSFMVFIRQLVSGHEFKERTVKILKTGSEGVFFVYLLEPQLRAWFEFIYNGLSPYITWFPATLIWLMTAVFAGLVAAYLLHLIPGVKKFI